MPETVEGHFIYTRANDESNEDVIRKFTGWVDYERSEVINDLPDLAVVLQLWELVTIHYDVSISEEVIDLIMAGDADFAKWNEFVYQHNLDQLHGWKKFMYDPEWFKGDKTGPKTVLIF